MRAMLPLMRDERVKPWVILLVLTTPVQPREAHPDLAISLPSAEGILCRIPWCQAIPSITESTEQLFRPLQS